VNTDVTQYLRRRHLRVLFESNLISFAHDLETRVRIDASTLQYALQLTGLTELAHSLRLAPLCVVKLRLQDEYTPRSCAHVIA